MSSDLLAPVAATANELLEAADLDWEVSPDDICDALWLARHLPTGLTAFGEGFCASAGVPPPVSAPATVEEAPSPPSKPDNQPFDLVFPRNRTGGGSLHRAGRPLTLPPARPLNDSLAVGRAMRPLRIRRPSRSRHTVDEVATADQAARSGVWQPILRPRQERWPDAALVVDGAATTYLWRDEVQGLHALLGQLGAFRQLRAWRLTLDDDKPRVSTRLLPRPGRADHGSEAVSTLHDPSGRRLIVVVTDGVHRAWGDGTYHDMLVRLGAANPVVVISLLPHWLWPATGLRARPGRVKVELPFQANASWHYLPVSDMSSSNKDRCPIPVLDLSPHRFGKGVRMLAGGSAWTRLRLLDDGQPAVSADPVGLPASDEVLGHFASRLSPAAFRLLRALACIPNFLMVDAIRALQHELLPESGAAELAEVLLCGVFQPPEQSLMETGELFRFRRTEDAAALAAGCSPAFRAAVRRVLGGLLADTAGPIRGVAAGGVEDETSDLLPSADVLPSPVPRRDKTAGVPGPERKLILRDIVCHLSVQSRTRARELLEEQGVRNPVLGLIDAAAFGHRPDEGVAEIGALRDAGVDALHLDNADLLNEAPKLRHAVLALIGAGSTGSGPQLIVLSRRRRTSPGVSNIRRMVELFPRRIDALRGEGPQVAISYAREYQEWADETPAVRFFRHTLTRLGPVPTAVEDVLWPQLRQSAELAGVPRSHFLELAGALAGEIRERKRRRLGAYRRGPFDVPDLPDDIDAFLRSRL